MIYINEIRFFKPIYGKLIKIKENLGQTKGSHRCPRTQEGRGGQGSFDNIQIRQIFCLESFLKLTNLKAKIIFFEITINKK